MTGMIERTTVALTDAQRDSIRVFLENELQHDTVTINTLEIDLKAIQAARMGVVTDDASDPEGGAFAFEHSQTGAQQARIRSHAAEVKAAIARLDAGTYGLCVGCSGEISAARREARPATAHCIDCAR
jgi:RNA polymerase-binding transcription factor DksA